MYIIYIYMYRKTYVVLMRKLNGLVQQIWVCVTASTPHMPRIVYAHVFQHVQAGTRLTKRSDTEGGCVGGVGWGGGGTQPTTQHHHGKGQDQVLRQQQRKMCVAKVRYDGPLYVTPFGTL